MDEWKLRAQALLNAYKDAHAKGDVPNQEEALFSLMEDVAFIEYVAKVALDLETYFDPNEEGA